MDKHLGSQTLPKLSKIDLGILYFAVLHLALVYRANFPTISWINFTLFIYISPNTKYLNITQSNFTF